MIRQVLVALLAVVLLTGCGRSETRKYDIKREPHFEPLPVPPAKEIYKDPAMETASATAIVEIGAFKGTCDYRFSGINDNDVVALADRSGLRSYRLAGIAIPPGIRADAHAQIRSWLDGVEVGVEIEAASPGGDPAAYLYRCSTKSMLNAELVSAGLAVVSDTPSAHREALNKASMEALSARRGVWGKQGK